MYLNRILHALVAVTVNNKFITWDCSLLGLDNV